MLDGLENTPLASASKSQVVILVHGIRDFALWQEAVRATLDASGLTVHLTNYGRFDLIRFLIPLPYFRTQAINEVLRQIRIVKDQSRDSDISVVAHSFGTYIVAHILQTSFDLKFKRIIFCGSVVRYGFPFEQFSQRFEVPILNEVGTRDIWPALAESITWGYGSAGTYGFRRPLVRDRWHNGARHGFFLDATFCERFWVPFLRNGTFVSGETAPEAPRFWIRLISVVRLKYAILTSLLSVLLFSPVPVFDRLVEKTLPVFGTRRPSPSLPVSPDKGPSTEAAESTEDTIDPNSPGANIRKALTSHGDIVDIAVEPNDIWVLAAKPIPNGTMHRNGDGCLFPDSDMFIIHINSETVASNKFTVLPFQKREQKCELLPDAIIYRDGDYIYCFVNLLLHDYSYRMHGQVYGFDPVTLDVKYSGEVFDDRNWGWFPQFVGQDVDGKERIRHWSSDGYYWVLGDSEIRDKQVPRPIASRDFKIYQIKKSEELLPARKPSDVINSLVRLVVRHFDRR